MASVKREILTSIFDYCSLLTTINQTKSFAYYVWLTAAHSVSSECMRCRKKKFKYIDRNLFSFFVNGKYELKERRIDADTYIKL